MGWPAPRPPFSEAVIARRNVGRNSARLHHRCTYTKPRQVHNILWLSGRGGTGAAFLATLHWGIMSHSLDTSLSWLYASPTYRASLAWCCRLGASRGE